MTRPRTLAGALARGRRNNLDAIRLAAAFAVVTSHAFPLARGPGTAEPLEAATGTALGGWAVLVFFMVSGLLVTRSALMHRGDLSGFCRARAARILPGLAGALVAVAALSLAATGGATTPADALRYVLRGLSLVSIEHRLPGLFADNPLPERANGPLWTLVYEAACYGLVAGVIGVAVLARRGGACLLPGCLLVFAAAATVLAARLDPAALAYRLDVGVPLLAAFALGAAATLHARHIPLDGRLTLALATLALALHLAAGAGAAASVATLAALGHGVLWLAYRAPRLAPPADVSYGVYLYGWPVAQLLVAILGPVHPAVLAIASSIAVLPIAAASWHFIERPALGLLASRLRPHPAAAPAGGA